MPGGWLTTRSLLVAVAICCGGTAGAQDRQSQQNDQARRAPLEAHLRFAAPDGSPIAKVTPGQPFRVEVTLQSLTGALSREIAPMAWIRPAALSDLPCTETAAAYRATGTGSAGSVDLNGLLIGMLSEDASLTILDPERSIGTANLIAAHRFDERPAAMIADDVAGRFILSLPDAGQVVALAPMSEIAVLADGLYQPAQMVPHPEGGAWVVDGGGDLLAVRDNAPLLRLPIGARRIAGAGDRLAVLAADQVALLGPSGNVLIRHEAADARAIALLASDPGGPDHGTALAWLSGAGLSIIWADAPDKAIHIPLGRQHADLAISPEGRYAFAYGDGVEMSVIDLSLGRVVQVVGSASVIAEIGFLEGAAVLRTADGALSGVMDLRMIKPGEEAVIGHFALGNDGPAPGQDTALLAPLQPEDQMLVVSAARYTGFVLNLGHGTSGKPPMESIPLRGGTPRIVRALDRGLREETTGRFATIARVPMAARYELVVSAGIGQASFCAPVPMDVPVTPPEALPGRVAAVEADASGLRLRLTDGAGRPVAEARGHLLITSLSGNWRNRVTFKTDGDGFTVPALKLPTPPLAIIVESDGRNFDPFVME
ncbi:hypothetical protein FQV27_07415 [Paracoccus aurantiacus]|uniref:Carboxypeptidase regulatory-like domain-containing protein n=1 Tax=Paracoccus aurantiacus TaxID=2599412 RepID=A0A5C6S515_9RHOB|nr:hypothetical protein [Paracoccus aurantiacus]TXB69928.1 hypothetical protein FQV27_07415 [Paracoccus aurantiacus]